MKEITDKVGLCIWISNYFIKIGLSNSFSKSMQLLFNVDKSETRSAYHTRFKDDIISPHIFDDEHKLLPYLENELYNELKNANNGDFKEFYKILLDSLELLSRKNKLYIIPDKLKNSSSFVLENLTDYVGKVDNGYESLANSNHFFATLLYSVLHYFGTGYCAPSRSDDILQLEPYRKELMERVILPFGLSTKPGMYQVMKLAAEGNSLALYECCGLFYYAIACPEPNYAKAFAYCQKAAQAKPPAPVAMWDYGWMLFNYKKRGTELENAYIPQLELMTFDDRVRLAITYEQKAAACGVVAGFNVLGNIAADESVDIEIKKEFNLLDAEKFWKTAADANYVFALGNLSELYEKKADNEKDVKRKKELLDVSFDYLKRAAEQYGAWANNHLALKYYEMGNKKEAYKHFVIAKNVDYIWGYYNLLEKYYLPAWVNRYTPEYVDEAITIEELIKACLNSKNEEIIEKTKALIQEFPQLLE